MFAERDKHYPSRSGQTSLAAAVTNITKPVTKNNSGPCILTILSLLPTYGGDLDFSGHSVHSDSVPDGHPLTSVLCDPPAAPLPTLLGVLSIGHLSIVRELRTWNPYSLERAVHQLCKNNLLPLLRPLCYSKIGPNNHQLCPQSPLEFWTPTPLSYEALLLPGARFWAYPLSLDADITYVCSHTQTGSCNSRKKSPEA